MEVIKIFNVPQAQTFVRNGCTVVDVSMGKYSKVAIVFKRDETLELMLQRWRNKEFVVNKF